MQEIVWGRLKPGHCIKDYSRWYMGFLLNKLIYRGTPNCAVIVVKGYLKVKGKTLPLTTMHLSPLGIVVVIPLKAELQTGQIPF